MAFGFGFWNPLREIHLDSIGKPSETHSKAIGKPCGFQRETIAKLYRNEAIRRAKRAVLGGFGVKISINYRKMKQSGTRSAPERFWSF